MSAREPLPEEEIKELEEVLHRYFHKALRTRHWNCAQFPLPSGKLVTAEAVIRVPTNRVFLGLLESTSTNEDIAWFRRILERVVTITSEVLIMQDGMPAWAFDVDLQTLAQNPNPDPL